ncbi:restriction endonuclease subunit S [Gemmata sp. JC717]|uniref:restriction endonuclease subunit S n=1 Tax=Gemmata algarum TaxID=2975278 RepID=UPI0021BBA3E4|nr:restriction endonuclease subunit S [Gemmata algarum]MDY3554895.1 restriction endonuclease subunit S [Gemmata algarum]
MEVKPGYKLTEVGVIPDDWELRPMLSAVRIANGQVDPKVEPYRSMILVAPDHIEEGSGRLLKTETAAAQHAISGKYLFASGDIVYSKIRPYLRKAILANFSGLCSADMYPLKPAPSVSAGFVFALVLGHHFSRYAESVSVRSGMPKINRSELAEYSFALPPTKAEQEAIATALSDADALIESLEQLLAKKRHVKQGAMQELLTGKRRLAGFTGEWEVTRLGDVCVKIQDGTHFSPVLGGNDYLYITSKNIGFGSFDISSAERISTAEHAKIYARCDVRRGDILFTKDGANTGNATLNPLDEPFSLLSSVALLRFDSRRHAAAFFLYQILAPDGQQRIKELMSGNAITRLTLKKIREMTFSVASIDEQTAIAAILSDMDTEIAALETQLAKARQVKQGMMQELLTGRVRLV